MDHTPCEQAAITLVQSASFSLTRLRRNGKVGMQCEILHDVRIRPLVSGPIPFEIPLTHQRDTFSIALSANFSFSKLSKRRHLFLFVSFWVWIDVHAAVVLNYFYIHI